VADPKNLKAQYEEADGKRASFMERCRNYAALTIPDVLPPLNQTLDSELPACWRNIGGVGVENMVGRIITSLYPIGVPWFRILPSADVRASVDRGELPVDYYNEFVLKLAVRELIAASHMENTNYRVVKRAVIESLVVCGNALSRTAKDYNQRYFRFDQWTCKRSGSGELLWTTTKELVHPVQLTEEQRSLANIKADDDKDHELYTRSRRVGDISDIRWVVEQEIDGHKINESRPLKFNPFKCVTYRLVPGEDYARGFISTRYPDLKSVNMLWEALIFGMGNAAKCTPVVDPTDPNLKPVDMQKPNGVPVIGRVQNGVVQYAAFLKTDKMADFQVAMKGVEALEQSLGKAMLLESEAMPTGDRVTATVVMRIAREMEGALGGPYAHMADQNQKPDIEEHLRMMEADGILEHIPSELARTDVLTGASALSKQMEHDKLLNAIQMIFSLGPEAANRLNLEVAVDRLLSYEGVDTAGLVKTAEQVQAELQQRMQSAVVPDAAKQAFKTMGDLVTQRQAAQLQNQPVKE
jgi:hypothetical protein